MRAFNERLGAAITNAVGTMWAAYLFAGIALVSLPAALASGQLLVIVAWLAQTFLQLVLLSVIMYGQRLQGEASEAHREELDAREEARHQAQMEHLTSLVENLCETEGSKPVPW
ncbi:MAG: hypothetical protein P4L93_11710 [Coriobacteriia bacterium]|nr:hypothetical protein [Coriobacteriia bacterium]